MSTRLLACVSVLLVAMGCARYFNPWRHLERYVDKAELVGQWSLTQPTFTSLSYRKYAPKEGISHGIELRNDGTCAFRSVVQVGFDIMYVEDSGSWRLMHDTGMPGYRKKKNELEIRLKKFVVPLYFTQEKQSLRLWEYLGDPDDDELLSYEKKG